VIQYNKRDLPDLITDEEIAAASAGTGEAVYRAAAINGTGVLPTFFGLLERTRDRLDADAGLERGLGVGRDAFIASMRQHVGAGEHEPDETPR
jgi:hypothetical protein